MVNTLLLAAASLGMTAVMLGAFGAHALRERLDASQLHSYETAVHYQLTHALALLLVGILLHLAPDNRLLSYSGNTMLAGTLLFSGSIYVLVLTSWRYLGPINIGLLTPMGGSLLIIGWALLAAAAWRFSQ